MKSYTLYEFQRNLSHADDDLLHSERPLEGQRIVLTGKLGDAFDRASASRLLAQWGAVVESTVTAGTSILLAVDPARHTIKRMDAAKYGTTVYDEVQFVNFLAALLDDTRATVAGLAPPAPDAWFAGATPVEVEFEDMITPLSDYAG